MAQELFVGNLDYGIDSEQLKKIFEAVGEVTNAKVVTDKETGKSKGFGFISMGSEESAQKAIEVLNEKEFAGRAIAVEEAKSSQDSEPSTEPEEASDDSESYNRTFPGPNDLR
ncbi:MAG: RNA recognition motif domain-containing protein [Patescibacteria group bacterium]